MSVADMIMWVDGASYEQLLGKWRFEPSGSPWFEGEMGDYYKAVMLERSHETPDEERVRVSKSLGWVNELQEQVRSLKDLLESIKAKHDQNE